MVTVECSLDDARLAANALCESARSCVRQALARRTGRTHKRFTAHGREYLIFARQYGKACIRFRKAYLARCASIIAAAEQSGAPSPARRESTEERPPA